MMRSHSYCENQRIMFYVYNSSRIFKKVTPKIKAVKIRERLELGVDKLSLHTH